MRNLDEGGGFLISYPDFSGCISDGESVEEATANGRDALTGMIAVLESFERPVPLPRSGGVASGNTALYGSESAAWFQQVHSSGGRPASSHCKLAGVAG
ncbi:type II toxin-antitoxin system HicB family antitoxin [Verminephrobacter aporrectodeae]|uniref:type II toxin-antitoxin system HicB family antitoxin n=1 Tax=Verminephrobacter aporrectodeae TaxID=1110389 RepID=UPI002237E221|nr:type II toxin-antitoxin system HicB family antitoxin [Verminephrobacter aporrectodeae]